MDAHPIPLIETPRASLRRFVPEDEEALAAAMSDPETLRFLPHFATSAGVRAWIEKNLTRYERDGIGKWALLLKPGRELIGYAGLARELVDGVPETEVGYALAPKFRGQGIAGEVSRACIGYAFDRLRCPRVISLIHPENAASCRVAERNGMRFEKTGVCEARSCLIYAASNDA